MAQTATVQIQMPEMGESVTEGIVLEWHVAEGDFVNEGDTVVEVSTDKVDAEVPAPTAGVITKLIAQVDDEVPVGAPLAEMEAGRGFRRGINRRPRVLSPRTAPAARAAAATPSPAPPAGRARLNGTGGSERATAAPTSGRRPWLGGWLRRTGSTSASVSGSGPGAKVTKEDVLGGGERRRERRALAPAAGEAKQLRGPAAMLAKAMDESREVPTATSFRTIAVDTLDAKRKALNAVLNERGMKVSFTHLVAWAIVAGGQGLPGDGRASSRSATASRSRSRAARSTSASPSTSSARTAPTA